MVSTIDLIAGIFTLSPLIIGYFMAIVTFRIYLKKKSTLVLLSAILFFALPSPWLGVSAVFLSKVFGGNPPNDVTYVFMYAWSVPIIAGVWNYTSVSLLKFSKIGKTILLSIISVINLLFLWGIYVERQFNVEAIPDSIFLDSQFTGIAEIASILLIATVLLLVGPFYIWIAVKTEDKLFKFKALFIGIGAFLFSISAGLDANLPLDNIGLLIVVRLFLVISLIFLYLGYNTPQFIRNRYE